MSKPNKYPQRSPSEEGSDRELSHTEEEGSHNELDGYDTDIDYGTPIRSRIRFTQDQSEVLEDIYKKNQRPSTEAKQKLAAKFNTTIHRIQIWFQNRRAKEKKANQGIRKHYPDGVDGTVSDNGGEPSSTALKDSSKSQPSSSKSSHKKKRRRRESEEYKLPHYPVQLASDSSVQRIPTLIPINYPFYQGTKNDPATSETSDYHPVISGIPVVRRTPQLFDYPHELGRYFYQPSSQTMNPQDMVYHHPSTSATTDYVQEPSTPPEEQDLNVDHVKYFVNDPDLAVVDMSTTSRQRQNRTLDVGHQQSSILAHANEEQEPELESRSSKKDRKGKGRATRSD